MERVPFNLELTKEEALCINWALQMAARVVEKSPKQADVRIIRLKVIADVLLRFSVPIHANGWCEDPTCLVKNAS